MRGISQRDRVDRDQSRRRARARAHLDRVRRRQAVGVAPRLGRRHALAILAAFAFLGAWCGDGLLAAALGGQAGHVRWIAVRGARRLSPAEIARATGVAAGAPLSEVDPEAVRASLEAQPWIARAGALRWPGGGILVDVVERRPVATVSLDDKLYAVDERGAPFAALAAGAEPELVHLVARGPVAPFEPSPRLAEAVRLARRLPELGIAPPREVSISADDDPEGYALALPDLPARVLLGHSDLDTRLEDLARLLSERPDAVAEATSIDLRFANQAVLRSEPAREGPANTAAERGVAPSRNRPTG